MGSLARMPDPSACRSWRIPAHCGKAIQEKEMLLAQTGAAVARGSVGATRLGRRGASPTAGPPPLEDPRFQYLKNLMIKYLCTEEFEVRAADRAWRGVNG